MKDFIKKYRHAWLILAYFPIYLLWFFLLEKNVTKDYYIISSPLDSYIPFVEWFIIPYLLWFPFIAGFVLYFIFRDKSEYYRLSGLLISGMTVFCLVCTFFPNGLDLRPDLETLGRQNIFLDLIHILHKADTSTNVCPSIHVYNSLAVCLAVFTSKHLKRAHAVKAGTLILTAAICMSTVFLKQHSVIDVICAFALAAVLAPVFYLRRSPKEADAHKSALSEEDAKNAFN
ncbi:MAG: phosphatase PAP2 family protein [Lachnospiraceae bacterium]|nr:phosphatase PAP2 family protein [Lachnospiraceae bacterium]